MTPQAVQEAIRRAIHHHGFGEFEQAEEKLHGYLERYPDYGPLQAAASVLAMDLEDVELARACASKAPDHPDAMATLGSLDLAENRLEAARELLDEAEDLFDEADTMLRNGVLVGLQETIGRVLG